MQSNRDITSDLALIVGMFIQAHPTLGKLPQKEQDQFSLILQNTLVNHVDNKLNGQLFKNQMTPELVKQFAGELHATFKLNELFSDKNSNGEKTFLDKVKDVLKENGLLNKEGKLDKEKLNKLTPELAKKFERDLKAVCTELLTDLENKCGLQLRPSPNGKKQDKDELAEKMVKSFKGPEQDPYTNLFGLINSKVTGGIIAIVQCFNGNGLGLNDWNPNHDSGMAPIDLAAKYLEQLQMGKLAPSSSPRPSHGSIGG